MLEINWSDTIGFSDIIQFKKINNSNTSSTYIFTKNKNTSITNIGIRVSVKNKDTDPVVEFTKNYLKLIEKSLSEDLPQNDWLDSIRTSGVTEKLKVALVLAKVQREISYLAITDGLKGLCPRPTSYTEFQKHGDCKAMALMIHQYLKALKINSWLAISATLNHRYPCNFPCIASGNHMVCVYEDEHDSLIVLDATDDQSNYPFTSRHTQSTQILILDQLQPRFEKIHVNNFSQPSKTKIQINKLDGSGLLVFEPHGILKWQLNELPENLKIATKINKLITHHKLNLQDGTLKKSDELSFESYFKVAKSNFLELPNQTIIDISFLPKPLIDLATKKNFTYYPLDQTFQVSIAISPNLKMIDHTPTLINNDWVEYHFNCSSQSNDRVLINYSIKLKKCSFSAEELIQINNINSTIQNDFNTAIVFEKYLH